MSETFPTNQSNEAARPPEARQETLQYNDGQLALEITGDPGAEFDWHQHKYGLDAYHSEAILTTESGNTYFLHEGDGEIYVVNMGESVKRGKAVAASGSKREVRLDPVRFHESWQLPGFFTTSPVKSVLLKYKVAVGSSKIGTETGQPDPFKQHKETLRQFGFVEENGFHLPSKDD